MYMKYDRTIKNTVQQATSQSTDAYYGFNVFHMRVNSHYSVLMRISKALYVGYVQGHLMTMFPFAEYYLIWQSCVLFKSCKVQNLRMKNAARI